MASHLHLIFPPFGSSVGDYTTSYVVRMPEERPWAAMMTSQYAASYQVVTIPREDVCAYI
ncbi:hypothetical protein T4A_10271 [Trichinella pseudospiralis]|uniref:Uncharacterized protein n=1 Tax=Trichinella pseudospiralis TaxID=6337 RepID=A0A0V1E4Z2_TRIPS|nr:hypothetical protein T4A_10271 [Trichinella pseudospiralis]